MIPAPSAVAKGRHDFETYSEAGFVWHEEAAKWKPLPTTKKRGLPAVGRKPYFQHPSADVLCYSYILPSKPVPQRWRPGMPVPLDLCVHIAGGGLMEAWNAAFERGAWSELMVKRYGFPELPLRQTRCAMARARAFSLPGALGDAGTVVGAAVQKDKRGKALLNKFSMPRNPTKLDPRRRILPAWEPDATVALYNAMGYDTNTFPKGWYVTDHADTIALAEYCDTDVLSEEQVSRVTPEIDGEELEFWFADQAIIERGVHIDVDGVRNCIAVIEQAHALYNAELQRITSCSLDGDDEDEEGVTSASKVKQLLEWLDRRYVSLEKLDEETVAGALKRDDLAADVRRVLEIRQLIGSASVKKVYAMLTTVAQDDRLHDLFNYHAARTGRVTGEGAQPTNMPNSGPRVMRCSCGRHHRVGASSCPWCGFPVAPGAKPEEWGFEAARDALEVTSSQQLKLVEHFMGDAMAVVSGCLRLLFNAAPGHDLISADYSSIEAVVLAMLAGVQWRIDVFRTHGRIYEASAAQMFGVSFEEIMAGAGYTPEELARPQWWTHKPAAPTDKHHPLRKLGKVAELALGYLGWVGAAKNFDMPGTDEEIQANILKWRDASPEIVELGGGQTRRISKYERLPELFGIEGAFVRAIREPSVWHVVRRRDGSDTGVAYFGTPGRTVFCRLPSGRKLTYHNCTLNYSRRPFAQAWEVSISYEGYNTNPKNGPRGWIRMDTYAGKLMENVVQATARDILRYAIVNLERAGYAVVLHVYDEIVSEIRQGWGSIEEFVRIMGTMPDWAKDWPIRVGGPWRGDRYRK